MQSIHRILQTLAGLECRNLGSLDLDGLTRARVTTHASGALAFGERSEANEGDSIAGLQCLLDDLDHAIDGALCICLGQTCCVGNRVYKFTFVHALLPSGNPSAS